MTPPEAKELTRVPPSLGCGEQNNRYVSITGSTATRDIPCSYVQQLPALLQAADAPVCELPSSPREIIPCVVELTTILSEANDHCAGKYWQQQGTNEIISSLQWCCGVTSEWKMMRVLSNIFCRLSAATTSPTALSSVTTMAHITLLP